MILGSLGFLHPGKDFGHQLLHLEHMAAYPFQDLGSQDNDCLLEASLLVIECPLPWKMAKS